MLVQGKVRATTVDGEFELRFDWDQELVRRAQALPTRHFDKARLCWVTPATPLMAVAVIECMGKGVVSGDDAFVRLYTEGEACKRAAAEARESAEVPDVPHTKTQPWDHQKRAYHFAKPLAGCMLFMGMGTGKSKCAVDLLVNTAWQNQLITRTLIVAPKSVLPVWPHQFDLHAGDLPQGGKFTVVELGKRSVRQREEKLRALYYSVSPHVVFVLNYESVIREPLRQTLIDLHWETVVLDESHRIKKPGGKTSRMLARLTADRRLALTGTVADKPEDVYGQYRFVDPAILGTSYTRFRNEYCIMGGYQGRQVVSYRNQSGLRNRLAPVTYRVDTDDVLDLPDDTHITMHFELDAHERRAYDAIEKDLTVQVRDSHVTAANALSQLLRLSQISSGCTKTEDDKTIRLGWSKAKLLAAFLAEDIEADERLVIFCRFHSELDDVMSVCAAAGREPREVSGRVNELGGGKWLPGNGDVMVCQIASGSLGIDLTLARYCLYYGVDFSLSNYNQSLRRVLRPGQDRHVTFIHFIGTRVEEKIYAALEKKEVILDAVLAGLK